MPHLSGLTLLVVAGRLATAVATGTLQSIRWAMAALANLDLPRWIHNLADVLQILAAVIALPAWDGARRGRQ